MRSCNRLSPHSAFTGAQAYETTTEIAIGEDEGGAISREAYGVLAIAGH